MMLFMLCVRFVLLVMIIGDLFFNFNVIGVKFFVVVCVINLFMVVEFVNSR